MRAYRSTLGNFYSDIRKKVLVDKILDGTGMNFNTSQIRAFERSLPELMIAFSAQSLPLDADVAIEMRVPLTMKRMDFIIAGSDDYDKDHVIIVELKQWDRVVHTNMPDIVEVEYHKGHYEQMVHPSWQAYTYESTICNFNEYISSQNVDVQSCAFLHNYEDKYKNELLNPIYEEGIKKAVPYIGSQYEDLARFVAKYIKKKSKKDLLFEISEGRIKPSKKLSDALGKTLNGNHEFDLIDEQRIVYSNLYKDIKANASGFDKHVYIVRGGMGTGKTLVAIQLLSSLIQLQGMKTFYVTKSGYVRKSYQSKLTRDIPNYSFLRTLFKGSGDFIDACCNDFDCLLVDEAHRLTQKTKKSWFYVGENQIKELIHASKSTVFFIDENQQIDIKDFGTIENIKKYAAEEHAIVHDDEKYRLYSQFRCNGNDEYIAWIDAILNNKDYIPSGEKIDYDIKIFDNLSELKEAIVEKNKTSLSRMLSGDVFPWKSRTDKNAIDIEISDFKAQWNKTQKFAVEDKSIDEVGCIHTSQGMDFNYVGLIIGDDLIYRDNKVCTDYTKHPEHSGEFRRPHQRKIISEDCKIIDRLIRNTYRVLLSRGQKGTYLYIMDSPLKDYIKKKLNELN